MARRIAPASKVAWTILAWIVGFIVFFPIFWMVLTSFKTELEAFRPTFIFEPTLEQYQAVLEQRNYLKFAMNSIIIAGGSTLLALIIAIPSAWGMAFAPTRRTKDLLLWMLSTKMMPAVGVLVPVYLLCRDTGLLDTHLALLVIYALINLPIVVWMLYTFFAE